MLKTKIEQVIREFEGWRFISIDGLDEIPASHEWPPVLAELIVNAITEEIGDAMSKAVEYGAAMGAAFAERKQP